MAVFQLNISNKTSFCASISTRAQSPKTLLIAIKISKKIFHVQMQIF